MNAAATTLRTGWNSFSRNWSGISAAHLAVGLVVLCIGIRVLGLGIRPLWLDEAYSAWFSSSSWQELWTSVPAYEPHPPFYYSLLKLWTLLWGGDPVALRSLSVMFAALTIPVLLGAARELERESPSGNARLGAWTVGILAACSPLLVELGQEARPYPMLVFAYAVAILGLLRLMREFRGGGAGTWLSWAILAAGTELALWAHSLGVLYGFSLFTALIVTALAAPPNRDRWTRSTAAIGLVLLLYTPGAVMIMSRAGDWGASGWLQWHPLMLFSLPSLYTFPLESPWVALFGAAAMVLLAKRAIGSAMVRSWNGASVLLLLWLLPPFLAVVISVAFVPIFLPRTLCATLVPAYLAMAAAAARIQSPRERLLVSAALTVSLAVCAVQIALREPVQRWDEVSAYLARSVQPGDQVWLYPNDSALPLREAQRSLGHDYSFREIPAPFPALESKGPIRAGSPAVVSLTPQQASGLVRDPSLARVPTVWLVERQSHIFDPDNDLPRALGTVRAEGEVMSWGSLTLRPYRQAKSVAHGQGS